MSVSIQRFGTWDEFKGSLNRLLFDDGRFHDGVYAFRGVGNEAWRLTSRFDREAHTVELALRQEAADELISRFVAECESDEAIDPCPVDPDEIVGLAQHNGLPTRALDWTESPYIAAFFAFSDIAAMREEAGHGPNVAIWALELGHPVMNGSLGARIVRPRRRGNERLLRQRGLFTYLRAPYHSLDEYAEGAGGAAALRKFVVPRVETPLAVADLRAMGITASRLFPDAGGAAREAFAQYLSSAASDEA